MSRPGICLSAPWFRTKTDHWWELRDSDSDGAHGKYAGHDKNDTCAWTPNKVFIHFLLVSVETARVLLQSWWARLSTGASREAPVDNECLGKCRQVGGSGESWNMSFWRLGGRACQQVLRAKHLLTMSV